MNFSFWNRTSVPVIRQLNQAECGLACVAMLASHYKLNITLESLRLRFPISGFGTKLSAITRICDQVGLNSRAVKLEIDELKNLSTPCILHWNMSHYVVLVSVGNSGISINDPSRGEVSVNYDEVDRCFTGIALEVNRRENFTPSQAQIEKAKPELNWLKLAGDLKGFKGTLIRSLFLAILLELMSIAQPILIQLIVDQVSRNMGRDIVILLVAAMVCLGIASLIVGAVRTWLIGVIQSRLFLSSSSNIFSHLLLLPSEFFERRRLGDVISRFNSIQGIQKILSTRLVEVVLDGVVSLITLIVLFSYGRVFALIAFISLLIQVGVKFTGYPLYAEASAKAITYEARQQNRLVESVRLAQTIRTTNSQGRVLARYIDLGANALNANLNQQRYGILLELAGSIVSTIEKTLIIAIGVMLAMRQEFSVGALVATTYISVQFSARSKNLLDYLTQVRLLKIQQGRLADIVTARRETNFFTSYLGQKRSNDLELHGVSFRYSENDPWIIKNLNLKIKSNDFIALVGPSGAGKSTIIKLLNGIISPSLGLVKIDDVDIEKYGKAQYRDLLGVALQDGGIFSGTIADNISMFDEEATLEKIEMAARMARVHADITGKPLGYNTQLGGIESHLSAGQRQKIILARTFYKKPDILILDEATCHIDVRSESEILRDLSKLKCTRIMVTHRWEAALYADRIFDVERGIILARDELIAMYSSDGFKSGNIDRSKAFNQ